MRISTERKWRTLPVVDNPWTLQCTMRSTLRMNCQENPLNSPFPAHLNEKFDENLESFNCFNHRYLSEQISAVKIGIVTKAPPPTKPNNIRDAYSQYTFSANITKAQAICRGETIYHIFFFIHRLSIENYSQLSVELKITMDIFFRIYRWNTNMRYLQPNHRHKLMTSLTIPLPLKSDR